MSSNQDYLRPQKHDEEKILPLKNVIYIAPSVEVKDNQAENTKSNIQQDDQPDKSQKSN